MEKFKKYIDKRFASYPKSRSLDELKEELVATLTERYQEYLSVGLSEDEGYQKAIESIGDCKDAVNLIESGVDKKTKSMRMWMVICATALYWLTISTIFLTISLTTKKWNYTWIIYPVAAAIFLCAAFAFIFSKGRSLGKSLKIRISAMLTFLIITVCVFFLVSFFTHKWAITWVIFPVGIAFGMIFDAAVIKNSCKSLFMIYIYMIVSLLSTVVHHLITYCGLVPWRLSWLVYLFAAIGVLFFNFIKLLTKYKSETSFKN